MTATIRPLGRPGDLGWVVQAHGEVYAAEYGWDLSFEALVARIVADYATARPTTPSPDPTASAPDPTTAAPDPTAPAGPAPPPGRAAWIAELDGARVGCVFCVPADERTALLRILLVHPAARGRRLGARLVDECVRFARAAGYERLRLWTNDPLRAARRIYLDAGFVLTAEEPHRSFGVDLVGQTYELALGSGGQA